LLPRLLAIGATVLFAVGFVIGLTPYEDTLRFTKPTLNGTADLGSRTLDCGQPLRIKHEEFVSVYGFFDGQEPLCDGFDERRTAAIGLTVAGGLFGTAALAIGARRRGVAAYRPVMWMAIAVLVVAVVAGVLAAPRPGNAWWCGTHVGGEFADTMACEPAAAAFRQSAVIGAVLALVLAALSFGLWRLNLLVATAVVGTAGAVLVGYETAANSQLPEDWPTVVPTLLATIGVAATITIVRWTEGASRQIAEG
jgi:hypothetical protein